MRDGRRSRHTPCGSRSSGAQTSRHGFHGGLALGEFVYEREVDHEIKNLSTNIEPIITIALGVLVLILALGVFLPIWQMGKVMLMHK